MTTLTTAWDTERATTSPNEGHFAPRVADWAREAGVELDTVSPARLASAFALWADESLETSNLAAAAAADLFLRDQA